MLTMCKLGPTVQTVDGNRYEFHPDAAGRAVCEVGYDHLPMFLARADVYSVVEPIPDPLSQNADRGASEFRDSSGEDHTTDHATAGQVSITKPRRGRRGIDDTAALTEMRRLLDEGAGLNSAASAIAARDAEGDPRARDTIRKRLLRKHKNWMSR